jgi:predicted ATP-grasp superfamily ATP-dependent carboligase
VAEPTHGVGTRVLVTDGEQRAALAIVRSLGRAGYTPVVASVSRSALAAASRYAAANVLTPDPLTDRSGFIEALGRICTAHAVQVLIPTTEQSMRAVLAANELIASVHVPFGDATSFARLSDKGHVLQVASSLGLRVPRQVVVEAARLGDMVLVEDVRYPIVLKPTRSVSELNGGSVRTGVSYAFSVEDLRRKIRSIPECAFPVLVQERIDGPGIGIFLLVWNGQVLASFAHKRLREKPPAGGVSVYSESIAADAGLVERSRQLLSSFGWRGVAMIEYKVDRASGVPYVMEVNGRFWGSLQLAIDAGIDFPTLLVRAAMNEAVLPPPQYRLGIRNRWWWGDVDHLLTRFRHSNAALALPPESPSRLRALLQFLALWRPSEHNEVFRWSDPRPFIRETVNWIARR